MRQPDQRRHVQPHHLLKRINRLIAKFSVFANAGAVRQNFNRPPEPVRRRRQHGRHTIGGEQIDCDHRHPAARRLDVVCERPEPVPAPRNDAHKRTGLGELTGKRRPNATGRSCDNRPPVSKRFFMHAANAIAETARRRTGDAGAPRRPPEAPRGSIFHH